MTRIQLDAKVFAVLLAELIIVSASLAVVFIYDNWLGAWGFVVGFTLLICAIPALAGSPEEASQMSQSEHDDLAA